MTKFLILCALFSFTLSACEQQKQASAEVGTIPKTIIDKATNDINAAEALENIEAPAEAEK